jgi:hypothetical protein
MNRRQLLIASTGAAALGAAKTRAADKPTTGATRQVDNVILIPLGCS